MNKNEFYNNSLYRILMPILSGIFIYILILLVFNNLDTLPDIFYSRELLITIIISTILLETLRLWFTQFKNVCTPEGLDWLKVFSLLGLGFGSMLLAVHIVLIIHFYLLLGQFVYTTEITVFTLIYSVFTFLLILMFLVYHFQESRSQLMIKQEEEHKQKLELEFHKFRKNHYPDILFNNLEMLISMVNQPKKSDTVVEKLSDFYRDIIESRNEDIIELKKELDTVSCFFDLLNIQYKDCISLEYQCSKASTNNFYIIPLSLIDLIQAIINTSVVNAHTGPHFNLKTENKELLIEFSRIQKLNTPNIEKLIPEELHKQLNRYSNNIISCKSVNEIEVINIPLISI